MHVLTLDDKVDLRGLGLLFGLDGAGVGALVIHVHLLDAQAVLQLAFGHQVHPRVQGPLVGAGEDDVGAIKPGDFGDLVIHITPGNTAEGKEVTKYKSIVFFQLHIHSSGILERGPIPY